MIRNWLWRLLASVLVSLLASSAYAGVVKEMIRHPVRTGTAAVAVGALIYMNTKKSTGNGCSEDSTGLGQGSGSGCKEVAGKPSLAEKADLLLLKATTTKLRKNMAANGEEKANGCAAHHIVPHSENRKWARKDAEESRQLLRACGIDLDDAVNGVYLPYENDAECTGPDHNGLHSKAYYSAIVQALRAAFNRGCGSMEQEMGKIKNALKTEQLTARGWVR